MKKLTQVLWMPLLAMVLAACSASPLASGQPLLTAHPSAQQPETPSAPAESAPQEAARRITAYTLPAEAYQKAKHLEKIRVAFLIVAPLYGLIVICLILRGRVAPKYRDWAESSSSKRIVQVLIFAPLIVLTMDVLGLPTGIFENWELRQYGLSVQGWRSWSWDWMKGELVSVVLGIVLITILYAVIRKSPRRWWFYFWLAILPVELLLIFLQPLVIDPMFHQFVPLSQKNPALTVALEQMVKRAGEDIPPERMFWMNASEKVTELNAYVTGFGASKRIVVWDTTIAKMTTPQIVAVAGHEMGHYVLLHIPKQIAFYSVFFFVIFYLGYRCTAGLLARWGPVWGIRGVDDWASLPVLLLVLGFFSFLATPITNAVSRHYEHQADQYALEITHGLTPDASQVAAQMFQILGEVDFEYPNPSRIDVLLTYDHPAIRDRVRFALRYNPWSNGGQGEFVH
jgi:STE24 endopeptidase